MSDRLVAQERHERFKKTDTRPKETYDVAPAVSKSDHIRASLLDRPHGVQKIRKVSS